MAIPSEDLPRFDESTDPARAGTRAVLRLRRPLRPRVRFGVWWLILMSIGCAAFCSAGLTAESPSAVTWREAARYVIHLWFGLATVLWLWQIVFMVRVACRGQSSDLGAGGTTDWAVVWGLFLVGCVLLYGQFAGWLKDVPDSPFLR